jgi:hypothetical protein
MNHHLSSPYLSLLITIYNHHLSLLITIYNHYENHMMTWWSWNFGVSKFATINFRSHFLWTSSVSQRSLSLVWWWSPEGGQNAAKIPWISLLIISPRHENIWLVVTGTWMDYAFPYKNNHPNWRVVIFIRGIKPPTSTYIYIYIYIHTLVICVWYIWSVVVNGA